MRAHRLLLAAALLTVLLTTSVLAALAGFTSSVGDAGIRRALVTTDAAGTPLLLQSSVGYQGRAEETGAVRALAAKAFPGLPVAVSSYAQSDPYGMGGAKSDSGDVVNLGSLDRSRLTLVSGSWPGAGQPGGAVPVAVPTSAATRFGTHGAAVRPGAEFTVKDRLGGGSLRIRVTGLYRPRDTADRYWQLDPLGGRGVSPNSSGSTYGPLLVDDGSFADGALAQNLGVWEVIADFSGLHGGDLDRLAAANAGAVAALSAPAAASVGPSASSLAGTTVLPDLLRQLTTGLVVARSTLLVGVLQLAVLALMTLLLAARLLTDEREAENALLRARGAARTRLTGLAAAEAALLVLPALVLAPLLASPLIQLIGRYGPLAASGVRLDGQLPSSAWWVTVAAALGSALVVLSPTLARARGWSEQKQRRSRPGAVPGVLRGGVDLALVALAGAAYWQLRGGGSSGALSTDRGGALGVDPVLVAAPVLMLSAGTVLALRLLPLIARAGERMSARLRGLPAALVGWQVARRPQQGAGPVLVLTLAAAIGTLALGQSSTWQQSQADQTAFNTGGALRIPASAAPGFGQGGSYAAVPGVDSAVPVGRESVSESGSRLGELIALDTRAEAGLLPLRTAPGGRSAAQLLRSLAGPTATGGLTLPGRPRTLSLDVTAAGSADPVDQEGIPDQPGGPPRTTAVDSLQVQLTDRYGLRYTLLAPDLPVDGHPHTLPVDLAAAAGTGTPSYPLTLTGLTLQAPMGSDSTTTQQVTVHAVRGDAAVADPTGVTWSASYDSGQVTVGYSGGPTGRSAKDQLLLGLTTQADTEADGQSDSPAAPTGTVTLRPKAAVGAAKVISGIADQRFLDSSGAKVGQTVPIPSGQGTVQVRITAVVGAVPGTGAAAEQGLSGSALVHGNGFGSAQADNYGGALLVDLAAYERSADAAQAQQLIPGEWWLNTADSPGSDQRVAAAVRALPGVQTVYVRSEITTALRHDPLGTGPEAALLAAVALAVVLAAVGFTVDATGTVRRRAGEFAVLRAMGAPRGLVARSVAAELVIPVFTGIGVGVLLGALLTRLIVPLLILTPQGLRPVPAVRVHIPGGPLCLLLLAIAAVPLLVAALSGLRGGDPARRLRQPEES
ncbi:FtsX-like permease family protein [Streptacidiphilus sp. PAMC 29251]